MRGVQRQWPGLNFDPTKNSGQSSIGWKPRFRVPGQVRSRPRTFQSRLENRNFVIFLIIFFVYLLSVPQISNETLSHFSNSLPSFCLSIRGPNRFKKIKIERQEIREFRCTGSTNFGLIEYGAGPVHTLENNSKTSCLLVYNSTIYHHIKNKEFNKKFII